MSNMELAAEKGFHTRVLWANFWQCIMRYDLKSVNEMAAAGSRTGSNRPSQMRDRRVQATLESEPSDVKGYPSSSSHTVCSLEMVITPLG